ncbi:hypothetical protein L6164_005651 [Bauhinia variegata]|uniref:Uncharacterized protein n=1 Tax=Bauhinia variegata TaxID=167791 RepID=A0ACB9PXC2_BAUVA|nr:hypothetical protein L6164_005651 [Bauhinia variegata]
MYRSASWSRSVPDEEYFKNVTTSPSTFDNNELPVYDNNVAEFAKKEKARAKFAENAVHVIPFVLLLCAITLWFFSNPDVGIKGDTISASIEGLSLEGEFDNDSDGTQTGVLPILNPGDIPANKFGDDKVSINLRTI